MFSGSCALTSSEKREEMSPTAPALRHAAMFPPTRLCQTSGASPRARREARVTWAWEPPPPVTAISSTEGSSFRFLYWSMRVSKAEDSEADVHHDRSSMDPLAEGEDPC